MRHAFSDSDIPVNPVLNALFSDFSEIFSGKNPSFEPDEIEISANDFHLQIELVKESSERLAEAINQTGQE